MGKVNLNIEGYPLIQSGEEVQRILDTVDTFMSENAREIVELLKDIKEITPEDDEEDIGHQLLNALESMVSEEEVQKELNDSTYPPQTKLVTDLKNTLNKAIDTLEQNNSAEHTEMRDNIAKHINAAILDHPDGSVTTSKLSGGAVTEAKIASGAVSRLKLSDGLSKTIDSKLDQTKFFELIAYILEAPHYKLSDLLVNGSYFRIPVDPNEYNNFFYVECNNFYDHGTVDYNDGINYSYSRLPYNDECGYQITSQHGISNWVEGDALTLGHTYLCRIAKDVVTGAAWQDGEIQVWLINDDVFPKESTIGGHWHYGTDLTHTNETVQNTNIVANQGDFYLNTQYYHVYYTQNGTGDWLYIGNLRGSVDVTKWASLDSPEFKGAPTAPTPDIDSKTQRIATTEFVRQAIDKYASSTTGGGTGGSGSTGSGSGGSSSSKIVDCFITGFTDSIQHDTITTTFKLVTSTSAFKPTYFYKLTFSDIDSVVKYMYDGAGGIYDVYVGSIPVYHQGDWFGSGLESTLPAWNRGEYYLYYDDNIGKLIPILSSNVNDYISYTDYKVTPLEARIAALEALEARVVALEGKVQ